MRRIGTLKAVITLAPEVPLKDSISVAHALMLSAADSLGALGPPDGYSFRVALSIQNKRGAMW